MVSMIPNPHTQTQTPQILNTTQKDQPDQKEPDPHHNGRERFREGVIGGGWEMRFDLELLGGKLKWPTIRLQTVSLSGQRVRNKVD